MSTQEAHPKNSDLHHYILSAVQASRGLVRLVAEQAVEVGVAAFAKNYKCDSIAGDASSTPDVVGELFEFGVETESSD